MAYTTYQPFASYSNLLFPSLKAGFRVLALLPSEPLRQVTIVGEDEGPSAGWIIDERVGELRHVVSGSGGVGSVFLACKIEGGKEALFLGAENVDLLEGCQRVRLGVEFV